MAFDSGPRVHVWVQEFKGRKYLYLQWHDPHTGDRKTRSTGTADPRAAEQQRADLEYQLNHGLYGVRSELSWNKFRELFEAEYVAGKRKNTQRNYAATLDLFEQLCCPKKLRLVTERTVSAFAAGLRQQPGRARGSTGMAASTIKVRLQFLHTALSWAVEQKLLAEVPKFPMIKVPKKNPQPVPAESFERMLEKAADPQLRAYLLCGWLAGLRLNEALALEREPSEQAPWLDAPHHRIVLPAEFVKADRDQWVPLDPALREALDTLPRQGKKVFRFRDRHGRPLTDIGVCYRIRALAKQAGVRLSMKTLRAGFGCRYAGRVPAQVLQKLMRHSNLAITMTYYANVDAAVMEAVLGDRRNTLRNTGVSGAAMAEIADDANHYDDGSSGSPAECRPRP
jgi:integrase